MNSEQNKKLLIEKNKFNDEIFMQHAYRDNIYVKTMTFKQSGLVYCGHHHTYDHVTLVASGKVKVKFGAVPEGDLPEEEKEYTGSSMFVTRSYREHEITSLEDNTVVCCIHAIRNKNGEIMSVDLPSSIQGGKKDEMAGFAFEMSSKDVLKKVIEAEQEGILYPGNADTLI